MAKAIIRAVGSCRGGWKGEGLGGGGCEAPAKARAAIRGSLASVGESTSSSKQWRKGDRAGFTDEKQNALEVVHAKNNKTIIE